MNPGFPACISNYFEAKGAHDTAGVLACFTPTATVVDEGEHAEMQGQAAIREWLDGPIAAYKLTTVVTDTSERDGVIQIRAMVAGDFPGSPIEFDYHFLVVDDKIDRLEIKQPLALPGA